MKKTRGQMIASAFLIGMGVWLTLQPLSWSAVQYWPGVILVALGVASLLAEAKVERKDDAPQPVPQPCVHAHPPGATPTWRTARLIGGPADGFQVMVLAYGWPAFIETLQGDKYVATEGRPVGYYDWAGKSAA